MADDENTAFNNRAESAKLSYTPGPWQSRHEWDWDGLCSIIGNIDGDTNSPTFTSVCDIDEGCDEFLANRNLICAAPDLLSAAKRFLAIYSELSIQTSHAELLPSINAWNALEAAIAKAEGKS